MAGREDYLIRRRRKRDSARNLRAIRRGEIERHARHVGAADTEDFWRWLVAWCWHNGQNGRDPVGALQLAAERQNALIYSDDDGDTWCPLIEFNKYFEFWIANAQQGANRSLVLSIKNTKLEEERSFIISLPPGPVPDCRA